MKRALVLSLVVGCLGACGGGDGGSGGNGKSASTGVRILHASIDAAPMEIDTSAGDVDESGRAIPIQTAQFATPQFYAGLKTGSQEVVIHERFNPNALRFSFPVTVEKNQHYSILFHGDLGPIGPRASLLVDSPPKEIGIDQVAVRVVHGLVGAAAIDTSFNTGSPSSIGFGSAGIYQILPATTNLITVKRNSDKREVFRGGLSLAPGKAYTVLVDGEVDFLATTTIFED